MLVGVLLAFAFVFIIIMILDSWGSGGRGGR